MLLQQIVGTLDAELNRLEKIREIVVKLGRSRNLIERFSVELLSAEAPKPASPKPQAPRVKREKAPEPKAPPRAQRVSRTIEASAFAKAIPVGPVVVSAKELHAREDRKASKPAQQAAKTQAEEPAEASDKLARDLSHRWLSSR